MLIKNHFDARYPFLWITTTEEDRVIRECRKEIPEKTTFFSWDIISGNTALIKPEGSEAWVWTRTEQVKRTPGIEQNPPLEALNLVMQLPENSIIFLKDYHKYFEKISVSRGALNLKDHLKSSGKTIVFISAEEKIPVELKNDIQVVDYEYPNPKELTDLVHKVAEDNGLETPHNDISHITNALRGLTWEGAENALALTLVKENRFDVNAILSQKAAQYKTGGFLEFGTFKEQLKDLYGMERAKTFTKGIIGDPKARGILLTGIAGGGKSSFAKALGNYAQCPTLILRFSALKDRYQGVAEGRIREAFKIIRAFGSCVVFMDEIEAIATGISSGGDSGVGMTLFKSLLSEMEDSRGSGAFWVGTSNDLKPLLHESGGAIMRRFNATFFIDMPSADEAIGIANIWSGKEGVEIPDDFDLRGYSPADIAKLAETMSMLKCDAKTASEYILPYGKANATAYEDMIQTARGTCIWANDKPPLGTVSENTHTIGIRAVKMSNGKM